MVNVGFDDQYVVDWRVIVSPWSVAHRGSSLTLVFSPFAIAERFVVYPRQEVELIQKDLLRLDS